MNKNDWITELDLLHYLSLGAAYCTALVHGGFRNHEKGTILSVGGKHYFTEDRGEFPQWVYDAWTKEAKECAEMYGWKVEPNE